MKKEQNKGYLLILVSGALWGTIGFFATLLANMGMKAGPVAFFRVLSATVMLFFLIRPFRNTGIALVLCSIAIMNRR